jgi:hypothetical protein
MIREALDQVEKIPTHSFKGLLRFGGLDQRKAGKGLVFQVAIHEVLRKGFKQILMLALEVDKKRMDALYKDPNPAQTAHIGFDVHRVNALRTGVYIEDLGQHVGRALKEHFVKMLLDHQIAHVPQRLCTQVLGLIGFIHNVQGIMPLKIEGQLRYGIFIGQIKDLLEQQGSQSGIEFLGRSAKGVAEKGSQSIDGKFTQNMFPKKSGP